MVARTLPATWTVPWRWLFVVGWFTLSALLLIPADWRYLMFMPNDWQVWTWLGGWMAEGTLYAPQHWIVWSPPMNWLLAFVVVPLGYAWWWVAHWLAVVTLRDWTLIGLTVLSVPFWADAMNGQTVTFAFVAGVWALRESRMSAWNGSSTRRYSWWGLPSRSTSASGTTVNQPRTLTGSIPTTSASVLSSGAKVGTLAFLGLAVLLPRPLVLPLTLWLLWREPWTRLPFVGMGAAVLLVAFLSGDLLPWISNLVSLGGANYAHFANLSPTKVIGAAWLIVGIPLATWLTVKGRVGLAGLALSPYVLPFYLLVALWEWPTSSSRSDTDTASSWPLEPWPSLSR